MERGKYVPCEPWFPELELGVKIWEGDWTNSNATFLRWCDLHGQVIPTGAERAEQETLRADKIEFRADKLKQRVDEEARRADEETRRADKLAQKLRAAGIDPDQP